MFNHYFIKAANAGLPVPPAVGSPPKPAAQPMGRHAPGSPQMHPLNDTPDIKMRGAPNVTHPQVNQTKLLGQGSPNHLQPPTTFDGHVGNLIMNGLPFLGIPGAMKMKPFQAYNNSYLTQRPTDVTTSPIFGGAAQAAKHMAQMKRDSGWGQPLGLGAQLLQRAMPWIQSKLGPK